MESEQFITIMRNGIRKGTKRNTRKLKENLNIWSKTLRKWNMKISTKKTTVMQVGKDRKAVT